MEEIELMSELIKSISYDYGILYVVLNNRKFFGFSGVPNEVFNEFRNSDAPDEYYEKVILPRFECRRMA